MSLRSRFYLALFVAIITITLHAVIDRLYLYWTFPQIDVPMHFLGGLMSALFMLVFLRYFKKPETLLNTFLLVLLVGIVWEGLEIYFKVADLNTAYWLNTVKDIINDVLGVIVGYYIWKKL